MNLDLNHVNISLKNMDQVPSIFFNLFQCPLPSSD